MMPDGPPAGEQHGYIKISRKAYESDPFWNEPREFSRWEAWEDLIQTAAWRAHKRVVDMTMVVIQRGQLLASERFLSERWGWSRSKVRRYLTLLQEMEQVEVDTEHPAAHVGAMLTVCNYDVYQATPTQDRPTTEPGRDQDEPKENAGKEGEVTTTTKKKRAHPLPDDWTPNAKHQEVAAEEGRSLIREVEKFRDDAKAKGKTFKDWNAAFRNWLRSPYGRRDGNERSDTGRAAGEGRGEATGTDGQRSFDRSDWD